MDRPPVRATSSGAWTLGDLTINRIGLGAMRLTQRGAAFAEDAEPADKRRSIAVLRRAIELGVNHIDTAAFYFSAQLSANDLIREALWPYPDDLVIATKVGPSRAPNGTWQSIARPDELRAQVEENLRQLHRTHLDVVNFRRTADLERISEHLGALAELRDAGLIRQVGLSGVGIEHLDEARAIAPVVCVQNRYSVLQREEDAVLATCAERGIAFVPYFAIAATGRHRGRSDPDPEALVDVARAHGATPPQVMLAWTLQQGAHVLAIPGTSDPSHVEENVAAGAIELTSTDLTSLERLRDDASA